MSNWRSLKEKEQIELFNNIASKTGLPSYAIKRCLGYTCSKNIVQF